MARKTFLYYLFSKDRKPIYVDGSGHVVEGSAGSYAKSNGLPAHLAVDPQGWKDTVFKYGRNLKYFGIFRSFTTPMQFVADGAAILRNRMWSLGVEGVCYLGIAKLDRLNLPYTYKSWYQSELNFSKYKEGKDAVTIEALEGGVSKYLKAYENVEYEIEFDQDARSVHLDGLNFQQKAEWLPFNGVPAKYNYQHLMELQHLNQESIDAIGAVSVERRTFEDNGDLATKPDWFLKTGTAATDIKLDFNFKVTASLASGFSSLFTAQTWFQVRAFDENDNLIPTASATFAKIGGNGDLYKSEGWVVKGTYTIAAVPPGTRLYVVTCFAFGNPGSIAHGSSQDGAVFWHYDNQMPDSYFNAFYTYRHRDNVVSAFYPKDLFEKLCRKMTGGLYGGKSDWLAQKKDIVFTSGDGLRELPEAKIKMSMAQFFKAMGFWSAGLGIEGEALVIENLAYFFKPTVSVELPGEVSGAEIEPATDLMSNTLQAGYDEQPLDDVNGRYGFNQPQQWHLPYTREIRDWDLKSPTLTDPYAIEHIRINLEGKDTTGSAGDNYTVLLSVTPSTEVRAEVSFVVVSFLFLNFYIIALPLSAGTQAKFPVGGRIAVAGSALNDRAYTIIGRTENATHALLYVREPVTTETIVCTVESRLHRLHRPAYTTITGVPDPVNVFNVELSPKRGILHNGPLIRSTCDKMDSEYVVFDSGKRNTALVTEIGGVRIAEKENIQIGTLGERLFLPYYITFTTQVPVNALELLAANPYGKVGFVWKGRKWYGFLMDGSIKPATNEVQQWKLLAAPNQDFSLFNKAA